MLVTASFVLIYHSQRVTTPVCQTLSSTPPNHSRLARDCECRYKVLHGVKVCIKNDEFCIKNDESCIKMMNFALKMVNLVLKMMNFVLKMMNLVVRSGRSSAAA